MLKNISLIFCFLLFQLNFAQEIPVIDEATELENLEIENNDLTELSLNPNTIIYINHLNQTELNAVSIFNLKQCSNLAEHIQKYGSINNIYELQQIEGFSIEYIHQIKNFLNFKQPISSQWRQLLRNKPESEVLIQSAYKLNKSKGYQTFEDSMKFLGSPLKFNCKYKFKLGREIELCFVNSKDNGEPMKHSFLSANFAFQSNSKLRHLVIGNYQLSLSQGLCLGNGVSLGKTSMVMNVLKLGNKIKPYRSTGQSAYFSGLASEWVLNKNMRMIIAVSQTNRSSINLIDSNGNASLGSLKYNSSNRNLNDLKYIDHIKISNLAFSFNYTYKNISIGINAAWIHNSLISNKAKAIYNLQSNSKQTLNKSIETKYLFKNAMLFNEISFQTNQMASITGMLLSLDKTFDISIIHRYFSKSYNTFYSMSFESGSIKSGNNATYIGIQWTPQKNTNVAAYCDISSYPWLKYNTDAPSQNIENFFEFTYQKRHGLQVKIRKKWSEESKNEAGTQIINRIDRIVSNKSRIHIEIPVSECVVLRHRIETNRIESLLNLNSKGKLMYSDIKIKLNNKTNLTFRAIAFNIDDYQNRIYTFENDLSQSLSIKAYQNKGHSYYVLIHTKMTKNLQIKYRFASVQYLNISSIGSGLDEVPSNRQKEIKIELKYKF